jgi:hypothetical protein
MRCGSLPSVILVVEMQEGNRYQLGVGDRFRQRRGGARYELLLLRMDNELLTQGWWA